MDAVSHIVLTIAHHVAVGGHGLRRLQALGVTIAHLACNLPTAVAVLGRRLLVGLPVGVGRIVVFAEREVLLAAAVIALSPTRGQQQYRH